MHADCSFLQRQWLVNNEFGFGLHIYIYIYAAQLVSKSIYHYICIYSGYICVRLYSTFNITN